MTEKGSEKPDFFPTLDHILDTENSTRHIFTTWTSLVFRLWLYFWECSFILFHWILYNPFSFEIFARVHIYIYGTQIAMWHVNPLISMLLVFLSFVLNPPTSSFIFNKESYKMQKVKIFKHVFLSLIFSS